MHQPVLRLVRPHRAAASALAALSVALTGIACDRSFAATFPAGAAHQPVLEEQALLALDSRGSAVVAQLLAAGGVEPQLSLLLLDAAGAPSRTMLVAEEAQARAVAERLVQAGLLPRPLLAAAVGELWPQALAQVRALNIPIAAPVPPEPGALRWPVVGAGQLSLALRLVPAEAGPPAMTMLLGEAPGGLSSGEEVELARLPLAGAVVEPQLWLQGRAAWMLTGSVWRGAGEGLHRTIALRRGSLSRGEATLHNLHGLADYAVGQLDSARLEFERALAADGRFVDALYNAASVAALEDRVDEAVALLRRAVEEDPRRVQVLGRDDDDLRLLRKRPDVRAMLGLVRLPPE